MDINTYLFTKNTLIKETVQTNIPSELNDITIWLKNKGFTLRFIYNPQIEFYSKEIIEGTYSIEFSYDLGEERKQILIVKILKNKWTDWKAEWHLLLDEVEAKDQEKMIGNDLEELKENITNRISHLQDNNYSYLIINTLDLITEYKTQFSYIKKTKELLNSGLIQLETPVLLIKTNYDTYILKENTRIVFTKKLNHAS